MVLSEQCKEIEENNRMRMTRNLFKKTGDSKETFQEKMGTIKDRNSKDLTGAEEIRRGGKNTQNSTEEVLMTRCSHSPRVSDGE